MVPLVWCLMTCFFCPGGNASPSTQSSPIHLPKILVAKDWRGFVTAPGGPFVPFGVTYYHPETGWPPQVWKQFDPEATRKDFAIMKRQGVNCVRVFLTYHSFYSRPGMLNPEGLKKFDQFLAIAEEAGIYVQSLGPGDWEGPPAGQSVAIEDENTIRALEQFWKLFAARYRGRSVIFAYELQNEPSFPSKPWTQLGEQRNRLNWATSPFLRPPTHSTAGDCWIIKASGSPSRMNGRDGRRRQSNQPTRMRW
jgi:aryl-phospho-beta-D-glucosidase BglC (GH1 family)